jgi:DUF971 family protein
MSARQPEPDVLDVTVDRPGSALHLRFDDGVSGTIALEALRDQCPCATCRAARQSGRPVRRAAAAEAVSVRDARLVGAWGLGITWDDGHATGIYTFRALHHWVATGEPHSAPDSGLGG